MKFRTITYQRVRNLGNYESERLEITIELSDYDQKDVELSIDILKGMVISQLYPTPEDDEVEEANKQPVTDF